MISAFAAFGEGFHSVRVELIGVLGMGGIG
jgi:hypothetical protein